MDKIKELFRNSRHYKMELFIAKFSVFFVFLMIIFIAVTVTASKKKAESRKTQALYTTTVTTSKTKNQGKVQGIYKSKDGKRVFLLWKFDAIENMPQLAKDYTMYLTKSDPYGNLDYLKTKPSGGLYVFGSTGYMGAMLINSAGFEHEVHSLVARASTELVPGVESGATKNGEFMNDESFRKYDQFQIFFNPGVDTIETLDILNEDGLPQSNMLFETLVTRKEEETARNNLDKTIKDMKFALNQIEEAKKRVDLAGMQVPEDPVILKGDKVIENKDHLDYLPVYVFMEGYNFDWRSGSIKQGYLEKVVSDELKVFGKEDDVSKYGLLEYNKFFDFKKELGSRFTNKENLGNLPTFALKDGTSLDSLKDGDITGTYDEKKKVADGLVNAWKNYMTLKKRYQEKELRELLRIELTLKLLKGYITFNDKALTVYAR